MRDSVGASSVPATTPTSAAVPSASGNYDDHTGYIPSRTNTMFLEFSGSHSYLYEIFGAIPESCLVNPSINAWHDFTNCTQYLNDILQKGVAYGVAQAVLLIADPHLLYRVGEKSLRAWGSRIGLFGFLHCAPANEREARNLETMMELFAGVFVFSKALRNVLIQTHGVRNVHYIPHPPRFFRKSITRTGEGKDRLARIGMLGKVRPEKNYEFVIQALRSAAPELRRRISIVMAGQAPPDFELAIRKALHDLDVASEMHLRPWHRRQVEDVKVVPDSIFRRCLCSTDVMVFPFTKSARTVISGHFGDSLYAGSAIVAPAQSAIGSLVCESDLGSTYADGDVDGFIRALRQSIDYVVSKGCDSPKRRALVNEHAPTNARRLLSHKFSSSSAA